MRDRILSWWKSFKVLFLSLSVLFVLISRICVLTAIDYSQLQKKSSRITSVKIEEGRYKSVEIRLADDENYYYQSYHNRFYDKNYGGLKKGEAITFYTTGHQYYEAKPLIQTAPDIKDFYYYPVFNINSDKNIVSVFFFHFYQDSWVNILLLISIVSTLFYSIPIVMTCTWQKRLIMISIAAFGIWLIY